MLIALVLAVPPSAVAALDAPELRVVDSSGVTGEVVEVPIRLSGDAAGAAVTADLDLDFPPELVEFLLPVREHCAIAPRLAATHQVGGMTLGPGQVSLAIFARALDIQPLGDGELVTCQLRILPDAAQSPAPLTVSFASLGDASGRLLPVTAVDGAVLITDLPGHCVADCDADDTVTVSEVIRAVGIALGNQPLANCPPADRDGSGQVTIGELIDAVGDVIGGC